MNIFLDYRWSGTHGLGRMTEEIFLHNSPSLLKFRLSPSSPFDPFILSLYLFFKLSKNDIFLTFGYSAPFFSRNPYYITIADLNYIDCIENTSFFKRLYFNVIVKRLVIKAEKVLTISEFSRLRIIEWSGLSPESVVNVGCGVSQVFFDNKYVWEPGYEYILVSGNRKLHKNESVALRAFSNLQINKKIKLVFTGSANVTLISLAKELNISDRVIFLGVVSTTTLSSVYRGAICLLFPSLYEGFGLPAAEAMASGTPVITSCLTSLPEVVADSAILINPYSVNEITFALEHVISDESLRQSLISSGLIRSRSFSWSLVAKKVNNAITN